MVETRSHSAGSVLRRVGGAGWLVLGGSVPRMTGGSTWMDELLSRIDLGRPAAWLATAPNAEAPVQFLEDLQGLIGAPVDRLPAAGIGWETCSVVILTTPASLSALRSIEARLRACLEAEGVVVALGAPAAAFGEAHLGETGPPVDGLGWLQGAIVLLDPQPASEDERLRDWLVSTEKRYALRLPEASILGLGPEGEVEVWGMARPGVTLGSAWRHA
ncbi:MAG TPA: hypothetical protein VFI11_07505 [Anaerolineales bacterium]|nr:hypothetical protein [Anaerolineales bacterium]